MPDDFDPKAELSDELDVLETARAAVADHPNVSYVSLGASLDDLEHAVWVRLDGDVDELDELRDDLDLPLEVFDVREHGSGMSRPVVGDEASHLRERVETPVAGYEVSPDLAFKNAGGTLGMLGLQPGATRPSGNRKLVSAAHVFSKWDDATGAYVYAPDVRQPGSDDSTDVVGRNPDKPLVDLDAIAYSVDDDARRWPNASRIADIGTGPVSGITLPRNGMRVRKVGRTTDVTTGRITRYNDVYFRVESDDEPLSLHGDSGGPWVSVTDGGEPKWVGINIKGGTSTDPGTGTETQVAIGIRADIVSAALDFDLM